LAYIKMEKNHRLWTIKSQIPLLVYIQHVNHGEIPIEKPYLTIWPIEIDDFPSDITLHLWLGFSWIHRAQLLKSTRRLRKAPLRACQGLELKFLELLTKKTLVWETHQKFICIILYYIISYYIKLYIKLY
jgi:hypothetical protein